MQKSLLEYAEKEREEIVIMKELYKFKSLAQVIKE